MNDKFRTLTQSVMYCYRVVIPAALQKIILKEFHVGHQGMSMMKSIMRSYVYWTNMDRDIENIVKACKGCALTANALP